MQGYQGEYIFDWIICLSPWRAMCMSTVTVLWILMHLQIFTHTHTVCQRLGVYFWQGELHASCKWWITSLRTNSEGQTERKDTVSLCLSFTTIAFILLFYVHKTRGHSFNWLWHNSNIFQTTEFRVNKEYFFFKKSLWPHDTYTVIKKFTPSVNVGGEGHIKDVF